MSSPAANSVSARLKVVPFFTPEIVIKGTGDWYQSYIVTRLVSSGSMIWTGKDDATDVCRYERCSEVPAEIVKETKDITE